MQNSDMKVDKIVDFNPDHRGSPQGDLMIFRLSAAEAKRLDVAGDGVSRSDDGSIRLLEGEVSGHHHTIFGHYAGPVGFRDDGLARALEEASVTGTATFYKDSKLADSLPWLTNKGLTIGFLDVVGGPVVLLHPEHDGIRLPVGTYYVGRQAESAGFEQRFVND